MAHNHLVHPASCACGKSELELFSVPPTQTAIESSQWVEYRPITTLSDSSPIEFVITGSGEEYVDLSESYLQVTAKILKTNGGDLAQTKGADGTVTGDDADVGPVNLWLHSLFSQVDVSLNERLVTPSMNTYPYRAYLETLLSYGPAAKESYLTAAMWYKDTAKHMEDHQLNKGFKSRQEWSLGSKQVVMIGRPHLDLCFQDRLMLNGVDIKMRLVRSKDAFSLMGEGKVKIEDVALFVRKVKVDPSVQLDHIRGLERMSAKYPLCRVETKVFSVPKHNMMANQENLFLGQLPNRMVIGMVENTAFNGDKDKNPYNFKHFDVNYLALHVDGKQIPAKPLTPKFDDKLCTRSYASLFTGTGFMGHDRGNQISPDEYADGFTLFAFDLTPDLDEGGHFHLVKQGNLRLELHFATQLPETINVIMYEEFDNVIEVDKARNVLFDYSAWIVNSWCLYWSKIVIRPRCSVGSIRLNRLPSIRDGVYVVNTAPHNHPGLHWIALFVKDGVIEYFDSYGGDPPSTLRRWGKKKQWMSNPIPLQSPLTSVCGQYCLYYLFHRARGIDMTTLLMDFVADVDDNDKLVYDFVEDRCDLKHLTMVDTENVICQLARARLSVPSIRKMVWTA